MGQQINEQVYEEVISALQTFCKNVGEACDEMQDAAKECVENCENDAASLKSQTRVNEHITSFKDAIERADNLISAMQQELEDARAAAEKADNI